MEFDLSYKRPRAQELMLIETALGTTALVPKAGQVHNLSHANQRSKTAERGSRHSNDRSIIPRMSLKDGHAH